jgi:hypothetical protein
MRGLVIWQFYILRKCMAIECFGLAIRNLEFAYRIDILFDANHNPMVSKYFQRVSILINRDYKQKNK